jgi:hypothetical protein
MENEELAQKILNDIQFIKNNFELLQKKFVDYQLSSDSLNEIQSVLNYFRTNDFSFIKTIKSQEGLLKIESLFSAYKISMEAFITTSTVKRLEHFIENNSKVYEYIGNIISAMKEQFTPIDSETKADYLQEIYKRIENLEKKPDTLIEEAQNTFNEIEKLELITKGREEKSNQIYENIQKIATKSEQKALELISTLEKLRDKEISVELAIQLEEKCKTLKKDKDIPFRNMNLFIVAIFLTNILLWTPWIQEKLNIQNIEFWQHFLIAFSLNIPWFAMFGFNVNEYTKLNKLHEEYEFRRISAITLFNNYSQLINELNLTKEDLHESLKSSLDKIFDNPVHSIYGDKSGDKNIGLDQLEKITSIIKKIEK